MVKNLPEMQDTQVQSLGQEDPLEKRTAPHSSILAWRIPWAEEPGAVVHGVTKSRTWMSNWAFTFKSHDLVKLNEEFLGRESSREVARSKLIQTQIPAGRRRGWGNWACIPYLEEATVTASHQPAVAGMWARVARPFAFSRETRNPRL